MPWRTSVVTNGRRIDSRSDSGMPGPVSLTTTRPTPSASNTSTATSPSAGVASRAFVTRFVTICKTRSPSPSTTGLASARTCRLTWRPRASSRCAPTARAQTAGEVDLLDVEREAGASRAARDRAGRRSGAAGGPASASTISSDACCSSSPSITPSAIACTWPWIAVSGVHSSCEIRIRKLRSCSLASPRQPRHLLEAQRELAELVGALRRQVHVVVAARDALARLGELAHRARDAPAEEQRHERAREHRQQQRQDDAAALHERRGVDRAHRPRDHDGADQLAAEVETAGGGERRGAVGELQVERLRARLLRVAEELPVEPPLRALRGLAEATSIGGSRPEWPTK